MQGADYPGAERSGLDMGCFVCDGKRLSSRGYALERLRASIPKLHVNRHSA